MKKVLLIILSLMLIVPTGVVYAEESVINAYATSEDETVINTVTFPEGETTYSEELSLSQGAFIVNIADTQDTKYSMLTITVYSDAQKKTKIGSATRFYGDKEATQKTIDIVKDGTYTVTYELSRRNEPQEISFDVTYYEVLNKEQALKSGKAATGYLSYYQKEALYKVIIEETGYISVNLKSDDDYASAYLTFLDSKKKEIQKEEYVNASKDNTMYYGVKKGTYYIKVKSSMGIYSISYSFQKMKDNGATTKEKATALKVGAKASTGIILADSKETTADWFKFTLKESTKVSIKVSGNTNNTIRFEIQSDSVNFLFNNLKISNVTKENTATISKALPKGTYYIKVYKGASGTSGNYSVQVQKEK